MNFRGIDYLEREEHANRTFDEQYRELWRAFDDQIAVHQRAGLLAPLLAARSLSMAIAGTDFFHHRHFAQTAEAYRRRLVRAMNEDLAYHSSSGRLVYTAGPELWASLPAFEYRAPSLRWSLAQQRWSLLALGLWTVLGMLGLARAVTTLRID